MEIKLNTAKLLASTALMTVAGAGAAMADPDWTGMYVGGMYSLPDGVVSIGPEDYDANTALPGGFVGVNTSIGGLIVGFEVGTHIGDLTGPNDYAAVTGLVDYRVRVGTTFGDALIYAAAGASTATASFGPVEDYAMSGTNYGVGVDYAVTDNAFVGVDYTIRDFTDDLTGGDYVDARGLSTISIRAGFTF